MGMALKDFREVALETSLERQTRACKAEKRVGGTPGGGNSTGHSLGVLRSTGCLELKPSGRSHRGLVPDWKRHPSILKSEKHYRFSVPYLLSFDPGRELSPVKAQPSRDLSM